MSPFFLAHLFPLVSFHTDSGGVTTALLAKMLQCLKDLFRSMRSDN